nr:hypothetical protein CFP56_59663 [Quercus suber]
MFLLAPYGTRYTRSLGIRAAVKLIGIAWPCVLTVHTSLGAHRSCRLARFVLAIQHHYQTCDTSSLTMNSQHSPCPMDKFEAADALVKYAYSGVLGSTEGVGVSYALLRTTDSFFTDSAALKAERGPPGPVTRYQISINRQTRELSNPQKIEITDEDMQKAIFAATGETVASSSRFTDGGLSISYKVATTQRPDTPYIVQLRHHGKVASMDAIMRFIWMNNQPDVIPMPAVYSIPGYQERPNVKRRQALEDR